MRVAPIIEDEMRRAAIAGGLSRKDRQYMEESFKAYKRSLEIGAEELRQALALSKEWTKQYPQNPKSFRQLTAQYLRFAYKHRFPQDPGMKVKERWYKTIFLMTGNRFFVPTRISNEVTDSALDFVRLTYTPSKNWEEKNLNILKMWRQFPDGNQFTNTASIEKRYHPFTSQLAEKVAYAITCSALTIDIVEKYAIYWEDFMADPMNQTTKAVPMDLQAYLQKMQYRLPTETTVKIGDDEYRRALAQRYYDYSIGKIDDISGKSAKVAKKEGK